MSEATGRILDLFQMVSEVPRPSRKEGRIRARLLRWADEFGLRSRSDGVGNLVIDVPATPGCEGAPTVVIQGHMDMVCEKLPQSGHNFETDPIRPFVDGEWLTARGTTLGADNGIAIAIALALAEARQLRHPTLELLFTVEEESGLTGAVRLDAKLLHGSVLINLDSEDEGVITVGSAGGTGVVLTLPMARIKTARGRRAYRLSVTGLTGGHSGIDIGRGRANANLLLARLLQRYLDAGSFHIAAINGGRAGNAIARDAAADIVISKTDFAARADGPAQLQQDIRREYHEHDSSPAVESVELDSVPATVFARRDGIRALHLLNSMPHGVFALSRSVADLVQTSNNLALVASKEQGIEIFSSLRSSVASELTALVDRHKSLAALSGAGIRTEGSYPAWQPDFDSELLARAREVYRRSCAREAVVEVVHAGLECGVIGARYPSMQMISIGPTIVNPHSPSERLYLPSLERTWNFLTDLLTSYCSESGSS